jgi:tRNA dimethylallyltransferase
MNKKKYLIVVGGPTGVGKSKVAINLAKNFNCDIISADSRQVYGEMKIGTDRLANFEMQGVAHHFLGHISVNDEYSAGKYERQVLEFLEQYYKKNDYCILCGGTGLYIKGVCSGLDQFPDIDQNVKAKIEKDLVENGTQYLQNELLKKDPEYYNSMDTENPRRLVRALSVIRSSGQKFSSFLNQNPEPRSFTPIYICINLEREILYNKINQRVDQMMDAGLIDEAKSLFSMRHLNALQTVGYTELFQYFNGEIDLEVAIEEIKKNTRRYAKRQITWFRNQGEWKSFAPGEENDIIKHIKNY